MLTDVSDEFYLDAGVLELLALAQLEVDGAGDIVISDENGQPLRVLVLLSDRGLLPRFKAVDLDVDRGTATSESKN